MTLRPLQVAVWGLGGHALKNVLPAMRLAAGVALRGVCSRRDEVTRRTAAQLNCLGWTSADEMLADAEVDVVYVSTPIGLHAAHGTAVLSAGKHLWCEKPIVSTAEEAVGINALSRARDLTVAEAFMYLHHPQFTTLRAVVQSGQLGRVCAMTCRFGIPPLEHPGFRLTPALGGGAFLDVGTYATSLTGALFPDAQVHVRDAAIVTEASWPVDGDGHAVLEVRAPDRVRVMLEWGSRCAYRNEVDVWGTDGSVSTDRIFSKPADYVPQFRFLDRHGHARVELGAAANHFVTMIESFGTLVANPDAAECERREIERRARLVDDVRRAAR